MILSMEDIKALCTKTSFERGVDYFQMGYITDLEQFGNKITAMVEGTRDYTVTIRVDKKTITATCTCPYDWGGYCKHIVATLIALTVKFPERYFRAYRELLIPFADIKMGGSHYRNIVSYLSQMKRIKGFEDDFNQLVNLLKTKYAKRPAFLDEMKYI